MTRNILLTVGAVFILICLIFGHHHFKHSCVDRDLEPEKGTGPKKEHSVLNTQEPDSGTGAETGVDNGAGLKLLKDEMAALRRSEFRRNIEKLNVSPYVITIIGLAENSNNRDARFKAMRQLTRQIPPDDIEALRLFLNYRFEDQKGLDSLPFNQIKNDIVDVLLRQDKMVDGLGTQLVEMFNDRENDIVWRDYCVQYFAVYYNKKWKPDDHAAKISDDERRAIEQAFWSAMDERATSTAGTAVMNLERLSRDHHEIDRVKLSEKALELVNDSNCLESARITALCVCVDMKNRKVLNPARELAQTGETIMLRMQAIAVIGKLGGKEDLELIQSLTQEPEPRLKAIADAALKNIQTRIEQGPDDNA